MTRPESETPPQKQDGAQGGEKPMVFALEPSAKLAAFREKLDAFRMRTRSSYTPIKKGQLSCPAEQIDQLVQRDDSAQDDRTRDRASRDRLAAGDGASGERLQDAHEKEQRDEGIEEPLAERFEIVMPPEALGPVAVRRHSVSSAVSYGSLAAGLACAAVFASAAALFDLGPPIAGDPRIDWTGVEGEPRVARSQGEDTEQGFADIETASLPMKAVSVSEGEYLGAAAIRALLAQRPVKCVVEGPASGGVGVSTGSGVDLDALKVAGGVADHCVETTLYKPHASLMMREAPAPGGGRLEINAAFKIEGDAICHQTRGLSALVIGADASPDRARSLESLMKASYADLKGAPICHRLQSLGDSPEGPLFRADAFVAGERLAERSDPRPFIMRRHGEAMAW